jgi:hypothetical protein
MKTLTATVTVLENEQEAKRYLLDAGVQGPSLHPHVNSENPRYRWNGWNQAMAVGIDADGAAVEIESWHFAAGGVDYSVASRGETGLLGSTAFQYVRWPIQVFPAIPVIRFPEHTP